VFVRFGLPSVAAEDTDVTRSSYPESWELEADPEAWRVFWS